MLLAEVADQFQGWLYNFFMVIKVLIGFSTIIFFHELGHFLAAKWVGIRVDRFAVGFGSRVLGFRTGEGITFGGRPDYSAEEIHRKNLGETDYCLRLLPIGGYVKMLGHDDLIVDEETGDIQLSNDPRAFTSRPVGQRMFVVCAGVVFNLLFAAALLTGVFMVGRVGEPPVIGVVPPDSLARGKLLPNDRVTSIDGRQITTMRQLLVSSIVSDGFVDLEVIRDGKPWPEPIRVETQFVKAAGLSFLLVGGASEPVLSRDSAVVGGVAGPKAGDRVVGINGRKIDDVLDVDIAFLESGGRPVELLVERKTKDESIEHVTCQQLPSLRLTPAEIAYSSDGRNESRDTASILGMQPRWTVDQVMPKSAANAAGFRAGDIILQWGGMPNPVYGEILSNITANAGRPVSVELERDGQPLSLTVTPRAPFRLFGEGTPQVGIIFAVDRTPVIAGTLKGTAADAWGLPRGALITAVDHEAVQSWADVIRRLFAKAGDQVQLDVNVGGSLLTVGLPAPSSAINELGLGPISRIISVNGEKTIAKTNPATGNAVQHQIAGNAWALRESLRSHIGETVQIEFSLSPDGEIKTAPFAVTEQNYDPWQARIAFTPDGLDYKPLTEIIRAKDGNPAIALWMGINEVKDGTLEVYAFLRSLAVQRNVGVEHVSGPVGIVSVAVDRAKQGWVELVYLMAFLSVNLAVINFLPIPVMDGGLMVFLVIEKIKGKPLSLKTQMISTLVGLAAIILIGLVVTFQDIGRLIQ
jgi:regulator of sigma E protease